MNAAGSKTPTASRADTGPALVMQSVSRRFGRVRALDSVSFEIARGETLAVFGANGSGKTTALRVVAGLVRPERGHVVVLGEPLPAPPELRRRVGMLAHEPMVYADLSARENLEYYARLFAVESPARVDELLSLLRLVDVAERPVRAFSRGTVQRLALARAMLHEPELLILDEPFTGLDADGSTIVDELLEARRREGRTTLVSSHDLARTVGRCDRALILQRGKVVWRSEGGSLDADAVEAAYRDLQ